MAEEGAGRVAALWRTAFDLAERQVGRPLERFVRTEAFASGLALTARAQGAVLRRVERQTRRLWHAVNLPSASDVRRVYEQLSVMDRRLQGVERRLDEPTGPRVADRQ